MSKAERVWLGCVAGFIAVLSKFLAQDYSYVVTHAAKLTSDERLNIWIGYALLAPILVVMGGFIAWVSQERVRMKLAALAISAPALITTWAGGPKSSEDHPPMPTTPPAVSVPAAASPAAVLLFLDIVPSAHAAQPADNPRESMSTIERLQKGVGFFFGYGRDPVKYRVIAGLYRDQDEARRLAEKINKRDPRLNAKVVEPQPGNEHFPVVVGETGYWGKANEIKDTLLATGVVRQAYVSPAPPREQR